MQRISWIDVARGIGIILVIQGHALSSHSYRHLIYAFHMPLFFFIAGLVFNYKKYPFIVTFKKSINGIIVPYLGFGLLSYFFWWAENANFRFEISAFLNHLSGIIYGNSSSLFFNIVLWFLPCLFITKISFAVISKVINDDRILLGVLAALSILGYYLSVNLPDLTLPFGIESALTAILFFGIGSIIKTNYFEKAGEIIKNKSFLILISSLIICLISAFWNYNLYGYQIDIRLNNLANYPLFLVGAFSGIIAVSLISILIKKNKVLELLGKYSLVLFTLHPIVFFYINQILGVFLERSIINKLKDFYLSPFYTVFTILFILLVVYCLKSIRPLVFKKVYL